MSDIDCELNEADLLQDADLQDVADFDPSPASSGAATFDIGDLAAPNPVSSEPAGFDVGTPVTPEAASESDFGAPADFAPSGTDFSAPASDFGAPASDFGVPAEDFGAPSGDFGAPSGDFGAPSGDFGAPSGDFGAPSSDVAFGNESTPLPQDEGPLGIYEREHKTVLEAKEQESSQRKQREIEEAKKDITEYFEERKRRTDRNREKHSASKGSAQSTPFDESSPWQNISTLVDLDRLPTKDHKDVSRMREVLKQVACK